MRAFLKLSCFFFSLFCHNIFLFICFGLPFLSWELSLNTWWSLALLRIRWSSEQSTVVLWTIAALQKQICDLQGREAGKVTRLWMDSSALVSAPLFLQLISGSTSFSKVLQEKLAITIKTLEDSWGSVHADHSLLQRGLPVPCCWKWIGCQSSPRRWGVTALATLGPSSLVASSLACVLLAWWVECLSCPLGRHHCPKEFSVALAVPFNSGS